MCILVNKSYNTDENFSMLMRHLPALAFLSPLEIPAAFNELREVMPPEANEVVNYFDEIYVNGRIRSQVNDVIRRSPPRFPPEIWSVYENNEFKK